VGSWPLVGRDDELNRIDAAVARGRGVLVAGPAGAGKTRLLESALAAAAARGTATLTVVASRASESIPLGCLSSLLAIGSDVPEGAAGLVGIRHALEKLRGGQPLVLAIDDAHWLDDASAALVHQLVAGEDVTAIASVREDEDVPSAVTTLWKDGLLERIDLAPLDTDSVVAVLERVLGGQVERAGALRLAARCRGNALFLRELLDEAERLHLLSQQHGVWIIADPPARSARLAELVADRIGDLDPPAREALELVALGEPIGLAQLDRVASAAGVEALEQRGLVAISVDGMRNEVRLAHPVHGDVVRAHLPELRRRRLLRALADDLEAHGIRRRGDPMRLALLRLDSGGTAPGDVVLTAAWDAYAASALVIAERLARAAHAVTPSFETATLLARILFELGHYAEQQDVLAGAETHVTNDDERAAVAIARSGGMFWGLADLEGAQQVLAGTETEVTSLDAYWTIRATRALNASQSGDQRAAVALLEGCPDPTTALGIRAHAQVALASAFALPGVGRGEDAIAVIDAAIRRRTDAREVLTMYAGGLLGAARAMALVGLGRLDEAHADIVECYDASVASGERSTQAYAANTRGWVDLHRGQLAEAIRYYREGAVLFRARSHHGPVRWSLGGVLFAAGLARDREVAAEAQRSLDELGPHPAGLVDVEIGRARAWAALAADDPGRARQELAAATELARQRDLPGQEAACLHDRVRLGDAAEVAGRLAELTNRCDGTLVPAMAAHAAGLVAGDVDGLEHVAEDFAAMGFLLKAAEAAMGASEAAARGGDQRRAARLAHRASELADRCETPATPMLTSPGGPVPLTNREREVALLAASGLTSRAIAERLFLSARTVDNHLARIYAKVGVSSRAELPDALG
jgi:DNA-binding CsgD family transcriptional regulator/tetratricopeptide (TPR) repeat protein